MNVIYGLGGGYTNTHIHTAHKKATSATCWCMPGLTMHTNPSSFHDLDQTCTNCHCFLYVNISVVRQQFFLKE